MYNEITEIFAYVKLLCCSYSKLNRVRRKVIYRDSNVHFQSVTFTNILQFVAEFTLKNKLSVQRRQFTMAYKAGNCNNRYIIQAKKTNPKLSSLSNIYCIKKIKP